MTSKLLAKYIIYNTHNNIDMVCTMLDMYYDVEINTNDFIHILTRSHMHYRACNNLYRILLRDIPIYLDPNIIIYLASYCGHVGLFNMYSMEGDIGVKHPVNSMDFLNNMREGRYEECQWMLDRIPGFSDEFCYSAILEQRNIFDINSKYMSILSILYEKYIIKNISPKECAILLLKTNMSCLMDHALWFVNKI